MVLLSFLCVSLRLGAISEIKLLQELDHPNVLRLMDIFSHHSNINLVIEYMVGDMEGLIKGMARDSKPLPHADVKAYMKMILQGIEHCHERWIVHRDMKPGNLLVGEDGGIKIGQRNERDIASMDIHNLPLLVCVCSHLRSLWFVFSRFRSR